MEKVATPSFPFASSHGSNFVSGRLRNRGVKAAFLQEPNALWLDDVKDH